MGKELQAGGGFMGRITIKIKIKNPNLTVRAPLGLFLNPARSRFESVGFVVGFCLTSGAGRGIVRVNYQYNCGHEGVPRPL